MAEMSVTIIDQGDRRIVEIVGEQRGFGGVVNYSRLETHYTRETLEALLAAKGETWLRDEIARAEEPSYVQEPLRRQFERFLPVHGLRVLDFGSGCSASSLCLARLGAARVVGVEPQQQFVEAARLRIRDSGLDDRVTALHLTDTLRLPFPDGHFDVAIMNAVIEHIPPKLRPAHLREVWRVLVAGGHLFIGETPNRLWPQDYHTTGLWGIPYMPLPLARAYAIRRGRVPADATEEWLLAEGLYGATYWELQRALGRGALCLNVMRGDDVAVFWARSLGRAGQSSRKLALKRVLAALHLGFDRLLLQPLRIPAAAFLPDLSFCFEKLV